MAFRPSKITLKVFKKNKSLQKYLVPISIFGPLLNQDYRHIWSSFLPRLQAYLVPTLIDIASIIGPPDTVKIVVLFKSLNYNLVSIEKYKFYVNITADPLYDDRTPMDLLVPSFFKKISFFVGQFMASLSSMFIELRDPYADPNWYKTDLDKIVGT